MDNAHDYSFAPGAGEAPPVLAGREKEKSTITRMLSRLASRRSPRQNIALIGPRGNGKTALLRWVKTQVGYGNGSIECQALNADRFNSHHDLVDVLANRGILSSLADEGFSATVNLFGSGVGISRQGAAKKLLRPVLEQRCSEKGFAILIDEAHTLDRYPDVTREFFNDVQMLAGEGRPLLLILAGTPNISTRLATIEATFWNRLKKIGIGLLETEAAREALRQPLAQMNYCINDNILDEAVNSAQCYPYFLQVVGDALYWAAEANPENLGDGKEIGREIWNLAFAEFNDTKSSYYADRHWELERGSILPVAEAVARIFVLQNDKSISTAKIKATVAQEITPKLEELARSDGWNEPAAWVEAELRHYGFIWSQIGHEFLCQPGIPSLMDYVMERARELEHEKGRLRE